MSKLYRPTVPYRSDASRPPPDPAPQPALCLLIEATANVPKGEHRISAGIIRALARLTKAELAGCLPAGFDPLPGVERGAVESFPASAITMSMPALMCERVAGGLYLVDVLSIVRAEHVGVSWIAGVASVSGPMLMGVVCGRVVAAAPPLLTSIADDRAALCKGSGLPADSGITASEQCPMCHQYVAVTFAKQRPVLTEHPPW